MGHYGLGDEDEISLDFNGYLEKSSTDQAAPPDLSEDKVIEDQQRDAMVYDGDKPSLHRSKDAGKTCKERFSYASFDAGATILKTSRGAKNAKAILVENKDSYMLLECAAESKYVILELSDDILIDTIVLANFEFFSSMIRQFQVSVSDRYPVKMDRWRDVGTFEARNSRDIQAFLVENPQIWAKYVRIQFLSHYGNEYYCPVSLLRVHGSRMLDSWKDDEAGREEESSVEDDHGAGPTNTEKATLDGAIPEPLYDDGEPATPGLNFTPWTVYPWDSFGSLYGTCQLDTLMADEVSHLRPNASKEEPWVSESRHDEGGSEDGAAAQAPSRHQGSHGDQGPSSYLTPTVSPTRVRHDNRPTTKHNPTSANTTVVSEGAGNNSTVATKPPTPVAPPAGKTRSTGTSTASAASPTVQEGFFNAITKRLQHVESNLTLSLQYLEDQSRYMQEALQKAEQKQLSKVTIFLENLNQTVMAELRGMRDQYEQLWQSTVIALDSQKEQSDRDIVALSSRLNLLADEVVFQKRMAIAQAVLLLCCLFLVIFSRGVPIPYLAPLLDQNFPATHYQVPRHSHFQSNELVRSGTRTSSAENIATSRHRHSYGTSPSPDSTAGTDLSRRQSLSRPNAVGPGGSHESGIEGLTQVQPSPPLTPGLQADAAFADEVSPGLESQSPSSRRLQTYQHSQNRKPLPALPEHPSPDCRSSP
jgi:hypothetical protein